MTTVGFVFHIFQIENTLFTYTQHSILTLPYALIEANMFPSRIMKNTIWGTTTDIYSNKFIISTLAQ